MKGLKNFLILAVFLVLAGVGFSIFSQNASGTAADMFELGKSMVKVAAALVVPLGIWFVAQHFTR